MPSEKPRTDQVRIISPKLFEMTAIVAPYMLQHLQTTSGTILAERPLVEEKGMAEDVRVVDTQLKILAEATEMVNLLILSIKATCELEGAEYESFVDNALREIKAHAEEHQKLLDKNDEVIAKALKARGDSIDPAMLERIVQFGKAITQQNTLLGVGPEDPGKSGHA